ncbi:Glycosyl-hydrolase 97 C-terminal, oligomerisation [Chitinophaga jiangningensis]|uniref:Glycosyl-hydrolase 97 C-terminal, oligomerisation n=1 Tax=Chitinophaga jiangningensis TaxID=1419482 RepID=A0A1M7J9D0_9BACT|nr:glycoside hydrolase family 97 protein [Chitinophaga jiangningensis]SHM49594.1 Glycosyl-hydrolase 97 C-terminal, oligomerisation [Chitinophaga jiangningensis]
MKSELLLSRLQTYVKSLWVMFLTVGLLSSAAAQQATLTSPNGKIKIALHPVQTGTTGAWYLSVACGQQEIIPNISLGLTRNDQDFSQQLKFLKAGKPRLVQDTYTALHGKRSACTNTANEVSYSFVNPTGAALNLVVRAYNDGIAFRYEFPEKSGSYTVTDELTAYTIPNETTRWLEKWNPPNELLYSVMSDTSVQKGEWGYPGLFKSKHDSCWFLLHEADLNGSYCGTKLSNLTNAATYKLTFPNPADGNGHGASQPVIQLPWQSPWRVIILGSLADVVASTLVDDVSAPAVVKETDWIKPGIASWNYWSSNHGTMDYKIVCAFADLAAAMNWPYTLLDWEWDAMGNGGKLEDAIRYIHSKGLKPLMWYNSGGPHTSVSSTPRNRLLTHESRVKEFTWLKQLGVAGIKVDFFESEKQEMIQYYLDILKDAADFKILVYFHGCLVPRGWSRTYPHLLTYEAVRGAEWYNYDPAFTTAAPIHNTILPFTRNVVGAMDYTPVTFTNSQFPHITSYGHELALSIVFESGMLHMADRPDGYEQLPDAAKSFLKNVPVAWDDTRLLDGYPGKNMILARRKGSSWYIGAISAALGEETKAIPFNFLPEGVKYRLTLITDGAHDKVLSTRYEVVDKSSTIDVKLLRRGGFVAEIHPL